MKTLLFICLDTCCCLEIGVRMISPMHDKSAPEGSDFVSSFSFLIR